MLGPHFQKHANLKAFHVFPVHILCLDAYRESKAHTMTPYSFLGVVPPRPLELSSKNFDFRDFPIPEEWKEMEKGTLSQE